MKKHTNTQRGFLELIALVVIAVLVISYFGFDLAGLLKDSQTRENIAAVFEFIGDLWNDYLKTPAQYVWEEMIIGFIWEDVIKSFID